MIRAELDFSICARVVPERLVLVLTQEQLKKAVWQKVIAQTRHVFLACVQPPQDNSTLGASNGDYMLTQASRS